MYMSRRPRDGFICYARDDVRPSRDFVEEIRTHFGPLVRMEDVVAWCDRDIETGEIWLDEIKLRLETAGFALLLVSARFLNSRFITEIELDALLPAAQTDGLLLLPVLVSNCSLPDWLQERQFENYGKKPLAALRPYERDDVYTKLVDRLRSHLSSIEGQRGPNVLSSHTQGPGVGSLGAVVEPAAPAGWSVTGLIAESVARGDAADLANDLSRELAGRLERIRERYRRGERAQASEELRELIEYRRWLALDVALRGRILRTAALSRLVEGLDIDGVRALTERAGKEDPQGDGQVLAAQIAYRTEGIEPALDLLAEPASPEARQLKAGILIESGQAQEAMVLLEDPGSGSEPDGGTFRLHALALLVLRRLPEAAEAIDRAAALDPEAFALRTAGAVLDFWRACTPAALDLADHPFAPMPFPRALVRADDRSRAALERTGQRLSSAIAQLPEGSPEWVHWATWHLISLLAAGEPIVQASELAGLILNGRDPVPLWALLWVVHYGIPFDREAVMGLLYAVAPDRPDFIVHRGVYYQLCLADGEEGRVLADLPAVRAAFEAAGELDVWRQWYSLALTAAGRHEEARSEAEAVADEGLKLRLRLHVARAEPPDLSAGRRLAAADDLLSAAGDPVALLEACNAHAAEGDWIFVSEHADALIAAVPTPATLRLMASAAWNRGDYPGCLAALDDYRQVFPGDRLPPDLSMLRVRCQRAIGDVSAAVRAAREAFERNPTPEGLIELLEAQVQGGDMEGMRQSLRRMLGLEGVHGDTLLRAADLAGQTDRELGASLWRKATEVGSDAPDFAVRAAMTGSSLGLGDETAPWFRRMAELAESGAGGATRLHISEMPEFFRAQREDSARIEGLYRRGEVPVHLLPEGMFPPLSVLFHQIPEANRSDPDPLRQPPVLVRHGARPMQRLKSGERLQGRLILDITALLTAADLELLDWLEGHFAPIDLTPNWHPLLRDEIRRLQPVQPERLAGERRVAALVRAGAIGLVNLTALNAPPVELAELVGERQARELVHARAVGGCLVDFLPLHGPDLADWRAVELPAQWQALLAGPRSLLALALSENLIDAAGHARACGLFGPQPPDRGELPGRGGALLVSPGILGLLAQADVLPVLVQRFRLTMPVDLWRQTEEDLRKQEQRDRMAAWVQVLIDQVAAGLKNGVYRILGAQRPPAEEPQESMRGLEDLLDRQGEPGDLIWFDDRLLNGYPATGTSWILGVVEILDLLRASGAIGDAERYERLARLRAGNYRYIPLEEGEVLHWLGQAHSHGGRLVVPQQLEILARYWSACLYQSDALQLKPTERHPHGELGFVVASRTAVDRALKSIWTDRRLNPRRQRQRADWILDRLYVGVDDIQHLIQAVDPNRDVNLPGSEVGLLVMFAYTMMDDRPPRSESDRTPAERYLEWICERVVAPRLVADPQVVVPAAAVIRESIVKPLDEERKPQVVLVLHRWTLRFLRILPQALRTELHKDQALMERLGLEEVTVIKIDGLWLATRDLWPAVESALGGAVPIIREVDDDKPLTLRLVSLPDAPQPVLELADAKGRAIGRGYLEHSEILSSSREVRLQALQAHPHWWDGQPDGCEAVERLLARIDSPALRMHRLERLAAESADSHYLERESQWRRDQGMHIDRCFPPALDSILTYVRCTNAWNGGTLDPARCWDALARSIPAERGLEERLRRVALLPSALPGSARRDPGIGCGAPRGLTRSAVRGLDRSDWAAASARSGARRRRGLAGRAKDRSGPSRVSIWAKVRRRYRSTLDAGRYRLPGLGWRRDRH